MQGCFNVLLPSFATKTSPLLPTVPGKHKPGKFWHTELHKPRWTFEQEQRKLPAPWPHACSRSGQKGTRPWLQESPWVLQQQALPGPCSYIHCQGTASSCAFCIPRPGSITSRKSVLEKTRIEVVESPQSHQSLKNPSWAQHPLHPSRQQG